MIISGTLCGFFIWKLMYSDLQETYVKKCIIRCLFQELNDFMHIFRGKQLLLYGEISKWVPMSYKRVRSVAMSTDDVTVTLTGGIGEQVAFWVNLDNKPMRIDCTISQAGTAILSVAKQQCSSRWNSGTLSSGALVIRYTKFWFIKSLFNILNNILCEINVQNWSNQLDLCDKLTMFLDFIYVIILHFT